MLPKASATCRAICCAFSLTDKGIRAGQSTYSTWLASGWNSISTTGYKATSPLGRRATITANSFSIGAQTSAKQGVSGSVSRSCFWRTIFTPLPSYPKRVLFQTKGKDQRPSLTASCSRATEEKSSKGAVGIPCSL